jgi:aspartate racemase
LKTIGLIGGMSWESTTLYYQIINREVARRRGGLSSARLNLVSLDFQDIAQRQREGDWAGMAGILAWAAKHLQATGAACVLIGTNTMHKVAPEVQAATDVPLLHIADVTADAIIGAGLGTVGLMGTRFTMEQPFYVERLAERGIRCVVPDEEQRAEIHRIIFEELCQGKVLESSREWLRTCIATLRNRGAQGVVLGCTELPLIVHPADSCIPTFDTTALHALAAVDFALAE